MPVASSGRIVKAQKGAKNGTPHQKAHRWESFTTKIAKLHTLDPLKKVRRHDLDAEDLSTTTSYLHNGLQLWNELNISGGFVSFKRQCLPLADSLPQILHFEDRIMNLFVEHISRQEKESLEPLLDLLTAFARDLGARFEKHYPQALQLIVDIANKPQDVEVIEWTFTALAFLFKRLFKLLVPDLRPTYDVISPLLGKTPKRPPHIARFAAEAMSFLIKKAAAPKHRSTALPLIVEHTRKDLYEVHGARHYLLFQDGLMTMYAEAIKGTGETIHSTGPDTFTALLQAVPPQDLSLTEPPLWTNLVCGVLTSLIHHSNRNDLSLVAQAIFDHAEASKETLPSTDAAYPNVHLIRSLGTLAGVRKGSRVNDWEALVQTLTDILTRAGSWPATTSDDAKQQFWSHVVVNMALVWTYAPVHTLTPSILSFTNTLSRDPFRSWYIPFCAFFSKLDPTRFRSLFLNNFQGFIVSNWSDNGNEDLLCVYIDQMAQSNAIPSKHEKEVFNVPRQWQDHIVSKFERLEVSPFPERGVYDKDPQTWRDRCLPKYAALLKVIETGGVHPSTDARIAELLLKKLKLALRPSSTLASDEVHFIVSQGLRAYLRMSLAGGSVDHSLGPLLRAAVPRFCRSVGFLEAYLTYIQTCKESDSLQKESGGSESPSSEDDTVLVSLIGNLSSPSHELRLLSLKVLTELDDASRQAESVINTMIEVEQTPLELAHCRTIVMHLRRLGQAYSTIDTASWPSRAIPPFLFGMLTVKMSPVWDGAVEALAQVVQNKTGEEAVSDLAFDWLNVPSPRWDGPQQVGLNHGRRFTSDFECKNVQLVETWADEFYGVIRNPMETALKSFDEQQCTVDRHSPNARSKALKAFAALPKLAEKKGRLFVPVFLSWAAVGEDDDEDSNQTDDEELQTGKGWSLPDRKAMIGVFGQFVNSKGLYNHEKVYQALLKQLENGDLDLQKLALTALLSWKQAGVRPYRENLEHLLEDNRFRNELITLFQGDEEYIRPEHRDELMPILLRLLYGRTISKRGASSRHGLHATRLAVLRNLSAKDMGGFLDIAIGGLRGVQVLDSSGRASSKLDQEVIPIRRQVGFLTMMASFVSEMGAGVLPYMETLLNSILYCLIFACRQLEGSNVDQVESEEVEDQPNNTSLLRVSRTTAMKCLISLFRNAPVFDWTPYTDIIVKEVVSPRIEKLPVETSQGVSGIMQLLSTWSTMPQEAMLLSIDDRVVPQLVECLAVEKGKPVVKVFVLGIIRNLVGLAKAPVEESVNNELIKVELLSPVLDKLLENITNLLETKSIPNDLLETCVETIIELAPIVESSQSVQGILDLSTRFLGQPARRINPRTKGRILLVVERFVALQDPISSPSSSPELLMKIHESVSALFSYFKDRENRESLCRVYMVLATKDPSLLESAGFCRELNSFLEGRIDEPDYDRRLVVLNAISKPRDQPLTACQWLPLLHNLLFFIHVDEEFRILSSNSADALRQYIDDAASCTDAEVRALFEGQLKSVMIPAIYSGAREESDAIRREYLRVMGRLVSRMTEWAPVSDMSGLLDDVEDDTEEEAAEPQFFFNILSPALSKQLEALRILQQANKKREMSSVNLANFFIPLLEHFVLNREEGVDDGGRGAQASLVIAELASSLDWKQYRSVMQRYLGYISSRPERQKVLIRLLGQFVDALGNARGPLKEETEDGTGGVEGEAAEVAMELDEPQATEEYQGRLKATLPIGETLTSDIISNYLPPLLKHLHEKDESEVSYRVPVGVIIVKLLKLLPTNEMSMRLASVLSDISQILRSKAEEARDMARDTLVKISLILGPEYLGFVLKGLKAALARGYQLHVLSYTVHSILLTVIPEFGPGTIDYCLPMIVGVIMDDIFGATGQEKDADGYTTQTKEIKSSKSQDSMELISKTASISHLVDLIRPIQAILLQKVDLKMVRKIDTLLSRITSGLLHNPSADTRDTLIFCYEVVQEVYNARTAEVQPALDPRTRRYLVQKTAKKGSERGIVNKHTYKLVRFALDILRTVLKRHDGLRNATNITGFIPIIGDAVMDGESEVKVAAFRFLSVIVKVPFPSSDITGLYKVAVKEATKSIASSAATTSELSQSALKFISVVLRDRRDVEVKDAAIDMLVGKLKDDLTDPQYRSTTFNFLRCVLGRKVETAAVYDILDYVGTVMITNPDKDSRDLARGAFFQFLRDYPQKKARWTKKMDFIIANLKYDREGGRISVMEVIHLLLLKSADDFVQDIAATCFLPVVFVAANDDSEKCRLAAGELLKQIFDKADKEQTQKFLTLLRAWLGNEDNRTVSMLALQVFGFYFDASERALKNEKDLRLVLEHATALLRPNDSDEETTNTAIDTIRTLSNRFPAIMSSPDHQDLWTLIRQYMVHSENSVRLNTVRLIASYLVHFAGNDAVNAEGSVLRGTHGAELKSADIEDIVGLLIRILSTPVVSEELATEAGRIIIFLAPHLPKNEGGASTDPAGDEEDAEDEVEEAEEGEEAEVPHHRKKDLHFLFWKLSSILRKQRAPKAEAINTKVTAMEVMETLCRRIPIADFRDSIKVILMPLYHLTDQSIPAPSSFDQVFTTKYEGLRNRAEILMDSLRKTIGTADYSKYLLEIREEVRKRRMERSAKRKIEAVTQPEKYGRDKRKKFERKKDRRKEKSSEHKAARQAYKRW
ncbi:related to papaya ringspot virus polyprotein [Cephalotrichum gorgonifer]|uniref:Related to papaya ringspot virus polyprotein n=1 Tax=Cephalotrichum gorgonifer TaxID=2041049 RepID=A0AAE8MP95_9PEZI|nr:related to papaya ringspot virus polyprotein [Cephalotrichum gorgonifer]